MTEPAEYFSPEAVAEAKHALWLIRLHSKSRLWRAIAPAVRAGLDDGNVVLDAYARLRRLEMLAAEIIVTYPHRTQDVQRILSGKRRGFDKPRYR